MTNEQIARRLERAKERLAEERLEVARAQGRRNYWSEVVEAMESRLECVNAGQIEMQINEQESVSA